MSAVRATFEIIFPDLEPESDDEANLHARVLEATRDEVIIDKSSVFRWGRTIAVNVTATFANIAEVNDHVKRFTGLTGVPSRDVVVIRIRKV